MYLHACNATSHACSGYDDKATNAGNIDGVHIGFISPLHHMACEERYFPRRLPRLWGLSSIP